MSYVEYCCECDQETGRCGRDEDSLYTAENGPFCEECYDRHTIPPMGHPLQRLGARLTELLDEDHFAECERLLLEVWQIERESNLPGLLTVNDQTETPQNIIYDKAAAMDNQDVPLEEWPDKLIEALARAGYAVVPVDLPPKVLGEAAMAGILDTGNPKHCWEFLVCMSRARISTHGTDLDGRQRG